jgi:hypothetical protein
VVHVGKQGRLWVEATRSLLTAKMLEIRVGLFICFDGLFTDVWRQLPDCPIIVSPSWWVNIPPLCVSNAMHAGMARWRGNVTLITASAGTSWFNSGSSIVSPHADNIRQTYNGGWNARTTAIVAFPNHTSVQAAVQLDKERHPSARPLEQGADREVAWTEGGQLVPRQEEPVLERITPVRGLALRAWPGMVGGLDFFSSPGASGALQDGSCSAVYKFSSNSTVKERYALVTYVGPYSPHGGAGHVLFGLSLCAVVRCLDNTPNATNCIR